MARRIMGSALGSDCSFNLRWSQNTMKRAMSGSFFEAVIMNGKDIDNKHRASVLLRVVVIGIVLDMPMIVPTGEGWAGNRSAPDVSPHLQKPLDIPLERLDRPQRPPVRLNVNKASPHQMTRLPGLGEAKAESISRRRPYKHKDELVTREIISEGTYNKIKDLITVE